jgi:Protein of unknown function (DUF3551)
MRLLLFILGISVGIIGIGNPAQAQNYPWCAYYNGKFGGTNCGFTTFQQCLDTVSGIGGFCQQNNLYQPPPGPHPSSREAALTHPRNMYMYVPRHSTRTHRTSTNGRY